MSNQDWCKGYAAGATMSSAALSSVAALAFIAHAFAGLDPVWVALSVPLGSVVLMLFAGSSNE